MSHIRWTARCPSCGLLVTFKLHDLTVSFGCRDGLEAVRRIRKLEASNELPVHNLVFALTGNARAGQVQSARDAGMDDVIVSCYLPTYVSRACQRPFLDQAI